MVDFDSVSINEEERDRDPIAHPVREDEDLERAVEQMRPVRDEDFESEVLALRNNLDEFVRTRVGNHNTHIGLMNNPTVNEVEVDGEDYQVVGERFFEMNQFPEFGDVGEIRWSALAPQDSWGMETPADRGEHAVGRGREIEAYQVTVDGEPLGTGELEALSQDVRISHETEQDFTLEAPRMIAEYGSMGETLENENITEEEFEEELRSAKHRGMVTEDLDLTLKGWMSFMDTNARGLAALERMDEDQDSVDLGGFRPSYVPPFGTPEGAISSSGRVSSGIFSDGEAVIAYGSDADADYIEGVLDIEDEAYQGELEEALTTDPVVLHDRPIGRMGLRDALQIFIEDYEGGEEVVLGEDVETGSDEEDYLHELLGEGLAGLAESRLDGIEISVEEDLEEQLEEMGYTVAGIEERLEEASQGLTPSGEEDIFGGVGGPPDFSLNYEGIDDPVYEMFASQLEGLDREQVNPDEDRDMDGSMVMAPRLLLTEYSEELERHGFDLDASTYTPGFDTEDLLEEDLGMDLDIEEDELLDEMEYGPDDVYEEGNIRDPKSMDREVRGALRTMEDMDLIDIQQQEVIDEITVQVDTSEEGYEHLQESLPDSGQRIENGKATYKVGEQDEHVGSVFLNMLEDWDSVEDYELERTEEWEVEYNMNASAMFDYEIDASIDSIGISDQDIVFSTLYRTQEMEYETNEQLQRAAEAVRPFNGEDVPYSEVEFETNFERN